MIRDWTEQQIAAHVDGSLDPREDARIRRIIASDPEARAAAERLRQLNRLLGTAYPLPGREMPDGIAAALSAEPGRVLTLPARRAPRWPRIAAAAAVAFAIGTGAGLLLDGLRPKSSDAILADAGPALERALETLASGSLSDEGVRPLSTFRDAEGKPCREFETTGTLPARTGIACRQREFGWEGWEVVAVVAVPDPAPPAEGSFAPASGPDDRMLDLALDALGAGPSLSPDQEAALIRSGWSLP
jgi:hypothetical protein